MIRCKIYAFYGVFFPLRGISQKEKVNNYFKGISLENTFKNFLWKKKVTYFLIDFYIFHKNDIKFFFF